jgi:hypothetical protein
MKLCGQTFFSLTFACGKRHWLCGTSIWWYPSIRTLPPSPDNVHVFQLVHTSMYWVHTRTYWYVPCLLKYFWGFQCCFGLYDFQKLYCLCMTCRQRCSNTKSVPLFVHHTCHDSGTYWLHTVYHQYHNTSYVLVCTEYKTSTYHYILNTLFMYYWSQFHMKETRENCCFWLYHVWYAE